MAEVSGLGLLEENWDSYGAKRIESALHRCGE